MTRIHDLTGGPGTDTLNGGSGTDVCFSDVEDESVVHCESDRVGLRSP